MRKSLLYKLTQFGYRDDIKLDPNRFMHVKTTKYGKVRIFKVMHVSKSRKNGLQILRIVFVMLLVVGTVQGSIHQRSRN